MDHVRILNKIRNKKNLTKAIHYALYDRIYSDFFFDYFEIEYVENNKEEILNEIIDELGDIEKYTQRPSYSYFPPKTDLCFRRMIYIPFKDLVIRYAFVIVLADLLDDELSPNCFANRRSKDKQSKFSLLEDFADESWPNFCDWQKQCIDDNEILLRTDISSFYDSISHDYLIRVISTELSVDIESLLMKLFEKILRVPVLSYSKLNQKSKEPQSMRQGIPIGNSTEGILANIYLKNIDEAMDEIKDIEFGRYNDDMRIFGKKRKHVLDAMLILQELLLANGLNLNAGKTQIAENQEEIEKLRTKIYDVSGGYIEKEIDRKVKKNNIKGNIDRRFDEFDRVFKINEELETNTDAKDFCKFFSVTDNDGNELLEISERRPEHIEKLEEIITKWVGSTRHAVWLVIQSAFYVGISEDTKDEAKKTIFSLLNSNEVSSYGKYRLIHHLVKQRENKKGPKFRFLDMFSEKDKERLTKIVPDLLKQSSFELNLITLYLLKTLKYSPSTIKKYAHEYIKKPIGEPIKNVLSYISELADVSEPIIKSLDREPDSIPEVY